MNRCFASFVRFIPKHFVLYHEVVNVTVFLNTNQQTKKQTNPEIVLSKSLLELKEHQEGHQQLSHGVFSPLAFLESATEAFIGDLVERLD